MTLSEASLGTQATLDWEETHVPAIRRLGWRGRGNGRTVDVWIRAFLEATEIWASKQRIAKRKATRERNRAARHEEESREAAREREKFKEEQERWLLEYERDRAKAIADFENWKASYECKGELADFLVEDLKRKLKQNPNEWDQLANRGDIDAIGRHMLDKAYERIMAEEAA